MDFGSLSGFDWVVIGLVLLVVLTLWAGIKTVLVGASPVATHYIDVGEHLEPAIASLEAHHAYNDVLPDDFPKPRELVTMILGMPERATGLPYSLTFERLEA